MLTIFNLQLIKVKKGNFSIPDFVPSECQDLLRHMVEKDPEKRYSVGSSILVSETCKSFDVIIVKAIIVIYI